MSNLVICALAFQIGFFGCLGAIFAAGVSLTMVDLIREITGKAKEPKP